MLLAEHNKYSATGSQGSDTDISKIKVSVFGPIFNLKFFLKMRMSEKCYNNNNPDNPLTSRNAGGKKAAEDHDRLKKHPWGAL